MKKNIALVTGGFTGESVISLKSAEVIEKNIDLNKFDVYKIIITTSSWYYENLEGNRFEINKNDFSLKLKTATINFD